MTRVLVVDDNDDVLDLLTQALGLAGYEVATARDGVEALRIAHQIAPQLALLDLALPGMDGFELAARLRETFGSGIVLVAVTGYGREKDYDRTRAAGFARHVIKPVDLDELPNMLAKLVPP